MKSSVVVAMVVTVALAVARPDLVLDFKGEEQQQTQTGQSGKRVEGSYSWTSPEGVDFYVKYVADENGYRVVESNAVPVSSWGGVADGNQGSFNKKKGGKGAK
ncbi:cuticle protein 16.8-like [Homarus americanus]|nr:cuticle protein 16.8-like [Homarus americanus]